MAKYPQHLCPLCGKVLYFSGNETISGNLIEVQVACTNKTEKCPYVKVYKLSIEDVREVGCPKN